MGYSPFAPTSHSLVASTHPSPLRNEHARHGRDGGVLRGRPRVQGRPLRHHHGEEGGQIRHVFFDTGQQQLLAFMEPRGIPGTAVEFDGSHNRPLGMPEGVYHFAFEAGTHAELEQKRAELIAKGVKVTPIVDHEWAKSIYFKDPNGLLLEYSYITREFTADDGILQPRFEMSFRDESPITDFRDR